MIPSPLVLVTGAAGVIGQALVPALLQSGARVRALDQKPMSPLLRTSWSPQAVETVQVELPAPDALHTAMTGCSGVIHLAAVSRVNAAEADQVRALRVNVEATQELLDTALSMPQRPWVLFPSSREVYGPCPAPVKEDAPRAPCNLYGKTKAEGETLVLNARALGLQTATLRLTNVYGAPWDYPDRAIPAFCRQALEGQVLHVQGCNKRIDFLHVDDVVQAFLLVIARLQAGQADLPTVHLATGKSPSLAELANQIRALARSSSDIQAEPCPRAAGNSFFADPSGALTLLGWRSTITLDEGLLRLLNALRRQTPGRNIASALPFPQGASLS